jgi:hypothetical protein
MTTISRRATGRATLISFAVVAALALIVGVLVGVAPPAYATITVPTCPATTLTRTGAQTAAVTGANAGKWDLTGASWSSTSNYTDVNSDPTTGGCVVGGSTDGGISATATRDCWFDGLGGCTKANKGDGYTMRLGNTAGTWGVIRNGYTENYEDAYDLQSSYTTGGANATSAYLDHTEAKNIRDDCLESEGSGSGPDQPVDNVYIKNSLWDGCFTGIGWRPPDAISQTNGVRTDRHLTIEDSLIHISNQPLGANYCSAALVTSGRCIANGSDYLGNYGLWKWSDQAPAEGNVTLTNVTIKLDGQSYSSCKPFDWPGGTYTNVTLVWDSPTSYTSLCSGTAYDLPAGVTFTTDTSVWTNAVTAWRNGGTPTNTVPSVNAGTD